MPSLGWLSAVHAGRTGRGHRAARLFVGRPEAAHHPVSFGLHLGVSHQCLVPDITCNTEGVADMARVLDFCLGSKLPAMDTWCPPYDHGGYCTFQHYGASLLKRLFSLDIGTGYNMGFTLLNTLTLLVGTGAAYAISGKRTWVAVVTLLVLLANFTGAAVLLFFLGLLPTFPESARRVRQPVGGRNRRRLERSQPAQSFRLDLSLSAAGPAALYAGLQYLLR